MLVYNPDILILDEPSAGLDYKNCHYMMTVLNKLNHAIRGTSTVEKGFVAKVKMFVTLAAPLLVSGLRKAKNTAIAMEARAFGAYTKRTQTKEYRETPAGIVFMILPWCITIGYFVMLVVTHNLGFLNT